MIRGVFVAVVFAICCTSFSRPTLAAVVWISIPDVSQIQYQTYQDGKVYLRNLNSFDSQATGGDYAYYIDTTTQEGKDIFALFLSFIPQGHSLWLGLSNGYAAGAITAVGNW